LLGDTSNPPDLPDGPKRKQSYDDKFLQPMFDWTKKDTVALAIELGLTDLMKISHSCTERKISRCGHCWQCRERAWAFDQNQYIDPNQEY
jgi:7-cyano-7-deazaguanine synthase in queuosine biosynthesis